jgi:hypothetical protein
MHQRAADRVITLDDVCAVIRGDLVAWWERDAANAAAFVAAAAEHRVEGLIVGSLRDHGTLESWPDSITLPLRNVVRLHALREATELEELERVLRAFETAAIRCLLMKGAALAYSVYEQPWLRPRVDTDILITEADATRAARVLLQAGYRQANGLTGEFVTGQAPWVKSDPHGVAHVIDLHWKVNNRPSLADVLTFDHLWDGSVALAALGTAGRAPGDADGLLVACAHRVVHHHNTAHLLWAYDIHALATRLGASGLRDFAALARDMQLAAVAASGLRHAARCFHTAIPPGLVDDLAAVSGEASAVYLTAAPWRGDVRLSDFRTLRDWRAKARYARAVALPSSDYMLSEYACRARVLVPALHVHRLARGTWRLLRRFAE